MSYGSFSLSTELKIDGFQMYHSDLETYKKITQLHISSAACLAKFISNEKKDKRGSTWFILSLSEESTTGFNWHEITICIKREVTMC